jgi:biopolymer transport protein ExbB
MVLLQDLVDETQVGELVSEEKTLSVIDLIFNGGAGSIIIISVLFVMLAVIYLF